MKPSTSLYRKVWGPFIEQAVESYIPDSPAWERAQETPLDPRCSRPAAPVQPGATPTQHEFSWWPCLPDPQASLTHECLAKGFSVSVPPSHSPHVHHTFPSLPPTQKLFGNVSALLSFFPFILHLPSFFLFLAFIHCVLNTKSILRYVPCYLIHVESYH